MNFKYIVKLSLTYLLLAKKKKVIHFISLISALGVLACTLTLILILAVFNGFDVIFKNNFSPITPDLYIQKEKNEPLDLLQWQVEALEQYSAIDYYSFVYEDKMLLKNNDIELLANLYVVKDDFFQHLNKDGFIFEGVSSFEYKDQKVAIVGESIYLDLGLDIKTSIESIKYFLLKKDKLSLILPNSNFFSGNIEIGGVMEDYLDNAYSVFLPFSWLKEEKIKFQENRIAVFYKDKSKKEEIIKTLNRIFGSSFIIFDQEGLFPQIFKILKVERLTSYLILSFILFISSFNIFGSVAMTLLDKLKEIELMKALGIKNKIFYGIFGFYGFFLGNLGFIVGSSLALLVGYLQKTVGFFSHNLASMEHFYPLSFQLMDFVYVWLLVMFVSFFSALIATRFFLNTSVTKL